MKCPQCQKAMQKENESITSNLKKGNTYKEYKREIYWCPDDDVWVSVEIPLVPPRKIA